MPSAAGLDRGWISAAWGTLRFLYISRLARQAEEDSNMQMLKSSHRVQKRVQSTATASTQRLYLIRIGLRAVHRARLRAAILASR